MFSVRRLASAAAAGALVLGLAACGGDEEEPTGTTTQPVASPTTENPSDGGGDAGGEGGSDDGTTEAADIEPPDPADYPGLDEQTPEGAEQASMYFLDTFFYAHATGDTGPMEAVSSGTCLFCEDAKADVRERISKDDLSEPAVLEIQDSVINLLDDGNYLVDMTVAISDADSDRGSDGKSQAKVEVISPSILLEWRDGAWAVEEVSAREV